MPSYGQQDEVTALSQPTETCSGNMTQLFGNILDFAVTDKDMHVHTSASVYTFTHTHTLRHIHTHYTQMSTSLRKWNKLTQASLSETSWSHEELLFIRNKRKYKKSTEKCSQSLSVSFNVSPFFTGLMLLWLDILLSNAPWSCNLTFIKL